MATIRKADARRMLKRRRQLHVVDVDGATWVTDSYVAIRADWLAADTVPMEPGRYKANRSGWERVEGDTPSLAHVINHACGNDMSEVAPLVSYPARVAVDDVMGGLSTLVLSPEDGREDVHVWIGYAPILAIVSDNGARMRAATSLKPVLIDDDLGAAVVIMPVRRS